MYETPEHAAVVNRTVSHYIWSNAPSAEIEQTLHWLSAIKADCDNKISQLKRVQKDRERAQAWRDNMNALAKQFMDKDALHLTLEQRAQIIYQRLDVDIHRARQIAKIVDAWASGQIKKDRNEDIIAAKKDGMKVAAISRKFGISRQQIYNILNTN